MGGKGEKNRLLKYKDIDIVAEREHGRICQMLEEEENAAIINTSIERLLYAIKYITSFNSVSQLLLYSKAQRYQENCLALHG